MGGEEGVTSGNGLKRIIVVVSSLPVSLRMTSNAGVRAQIVRNNRVTTKVEFFIYLFIFDTAMK